MCSAAFSPESSLLFQYFSGALLSGLRRDKSIVGAASRTFFESALVSSVYSVFRCHLPGLPADAGTSEAGGKGNQGMEVSLLVSMGRTGYSHDKLRYQKYPQVEVWYFDVKNNYSSIMMSTSSGVSPWRKLMMIWILLYALE